MSRFIYRFTLIVLFSVGYNKLLTAKIVMPSVFSDNMVLQQNTKAAIWGKSEARKAIKITVSWNKVNYGTIADAAGNWKLSVATPSFGGPYTITVSDGELITLKNVLIGDVWICSGQSNMEMPLAGWGKIANYEKEISEANYPGIRLLQAEHVTSNVPLNDAKVANGGWQECNPQYITTFSSTAYFFAREVYQKTKIPIGLIHTSWGGTIAEAWTSAESLKQMRDFSAAVQDIQDAAKRKTAVPYQQRLAAWTKEITLKDAGYANGTPSWATADVSSWETMKLPTLWEQQSLKNFDGIVWFVKHINIPEGWSLDNVTLNLGPIDDDDITFVNGTKIGETVGFNVPRVYSVPASLLKTGDNVIAVRVFDSGSDGGFYGEARALNLSNAKQESLSISGDWAYKIGLDLKKTTPMPREENGPNRPTVLYNAMIHPYIQFAIKGAIWYQGESNADRAYQYQTLFPTMIKDWRTKWGQGDFPFYFVQLANYMKANPEPQESAWAELREAQLKTTLLPNTGMATIIDIGDAKDIHPKNKQEVGRRLALIALAKTYGLKVDYSGPVYQAQKVEGQNIVLSFKNAENGLKAANGDQLKGFAIAGADKKFYWANAVVKGKQIVVNSDKVARPVAVRYAWADNPDANLVGNSGLPASPFKTDNWDGVTKPSIRN